jgi:hypothetical protein
MFELDWIDDLDADQVADELARTRDLELVAQASKMLLAARWADQNAPEFVEGAARRLPGMPGVTRISEDCPEIDEFAGAELAGLLGVTTRGGEQLVRDALLIRHRHPRLWERIRNGTARTWLAAKVARRCQAAELDRDQASFVDAATTPYIETLPVARFLALVDAKIIEADPSAAEERARTRALARFVRSGPVDEDGMKTLIARANAGDITVFMAMLDRIAVILAAQGDVSSLEVRRTTAMRILANPARALALLLGATHEHLEPELEDVEGTEEEVDLAEHPSGGTAWGADPEGRPVGLFPVERESADDVKEPASSAQDPDLLREVLDALRDLDPSRLDPSTIFHVHLTDTTLRAGKGVVRVEGLGPVTLGQVRDWLVHPWCSDWIRQQVRVRPVLDVDAIHPVDAYEWPTAMSDLATARNPYEVFPWGTSESRASEDDHVVPFRAGRKKQTRLDNNAKLGKRHHRIKTFGGWFLVHPEPGVYLWRTKHGHWIRVDAEGTHHLGRRPDLDQQHLARAASA